MAYSSMYFWGLFLPAFLLLYFLMPGTRSRRVVIFLGNVAFYSFNGAWGLLVLGLTSVVVYVTGRFIDKIYVKYDEQKTGMTPKEQMVLFAEYKKKSRRYLWGALFCVVGILVYVKIGRLFHWEEITSFRQFGIKTILAPLGISYYTFSAVGYLLDIYWRKAKCERSFFRLLLCMTFFPHIMEGPINKYQNILAQLEALPGFCYEKVCFGLQLFLWGLFKKIVVADRLSIYVNTVVDKPSDYAGVEILLALFFGAIQLYADFSGCMDMVCGISQCLGIEMDKNFDHPFFSRSAAEFWRRWHATLGVWFKDYIYMPIAVDPRYVKLVGKVRKKFGNRAGKAFSSTVPLCAVWILSGAWHGTGLSYLVWGLYWGGIIILSNWFLPDFKKFNEKLQVPTESFGFKLFQMIRTFIIFCVGRSLVMGGSLRRCGGLWINCFREHRIWTLFDGSLFTHGLNQKNMYVCIFGILLMWAVDILQEHISIREFLAKQPLLLRWLVYYGAIVLILVLGKYGRAYDVGSFIYNGF